MSVYFTHLETIKPRLPEVALPSDVKDLKDSPVNVVGVRDDALRSNTGEEEVV